MLYLFGVLIIGNIADILGKVHLGLDQFLDGYSREDVEMVQQTIISTYGNLRGKDYARKRNLRCRASITETTRATRGTIDYLNRAKREDRDKQRQKKSNQKEEKGSGGEEGDDDSPRELIDEEIDKMKVPELQAALKERGLRRTGIKAVLQKRLKNSSTAELPGRQQKVTDPEEEEISLPDHILWGDKL